MNNKKTILAALAVMCLTFTSANASSLVQMDIKKTSDSAVDVTFFTNGVSGNPMVTRKSNNKYVILMPNVAGKNAGTPDLSSVKDIITNVDVKNVDDGMSGYTKVTFITTKPLNIKTHIQKAAPVSQEEKDAKAVIAQVKTHPKQTVAPAEPKKEVAKTTVTSSAPKVTLKKEETKVESKTVVKSNSKKVDKIINTAPPKVDTKAGEKFTEIIDKKLPPVEEVKKDAVSDKLDIKEVEKIEKISKEKSQKSIPHSGWAVFVFPLLGLYLLAKLVRNSVQKSIALKASFRENLAEKPHVQDNYDDIINDSELNWQERYQKFVEESKGEVKNRKYTFISEAEPLNEVDKKRLELENTLEKTPEIYKSQEIDITEESVNEVKSEDEVISSEINTIKLKAFAKPVSLHTSTRSRVKKSLPKQTPLKEGRFVKLQENPLNASSRKFRNANLKVSDLITTGSQYLQDSNSEVEMVEKEQNYIMSSIDEYFSLLDKEQSKKMTNPNIDLSRKVAASLASVKPSMSMKKQSSPIQVSNPIKQNNKKQDYLNGLIIKSSYNIDENRGFHIVNLDGVSALVGRVNEEIFVLKKFDNNVEKLQVRLDSENVYMVKAGDFKSLVDVDNNKMGVLIEL